MISLCNCIMLGGKLKLSSQRVKVKIWGLRGAVDASNMVGWKNSGSTLQAVCFYALQDVGRLSLVVEAGKQLVLSFLAQEMSAAALQSRVSATKIDE
ncbi:hypothetical protein T4E_9809 [Trichinella pseudospiralis]|uniref:Uncharacterized protein n=1 Tax=Trichinella pseudospiralis TaxID=6337 RepID=A0A0V0Y0J6_TRIPS|nr:hypothetical protein T4E_9809 [Trichinella pseudospiralis]